MASFALVNATTYVHGFDFTTDLNQISLSAEAEELDATAFGNNGWRTRKGGLKTVTSELQGFWDDPPDSAIFSDLGTRNRVVTMTPDGAEQSAAYMYQAGKFTYNAFGAVGELTPFTLNMSGTNGTGVVRGRLAAARQTVSATGQVGSGVNLGSVGSEQHLYAVLHLFGVGTSITVDLESDVDGTFSAPTVQATIGPLSTTGGTWVTPVAGSISDSWFRFTVTAITGTFSVAAAIGVQ